MQRWSSQQQISVSKRELADGAVSMPRHRTYDSPTMGKYKETHVHIVFGAKTGSYDTLTPTPHNLGRVPSSWSVVEKGIHSTTPGDQPGDIYTDTPAPFSLTHVAFRCSKAKTWAVIALR